MFLGNQRYLLCSTVLEHERQHLVMEHRTSCSEHEEAVIFWDSLSWLAESPCVDLISTAGKCKWPKETLCVVQKLHCTKYVCLHNLFQQRNKMLLFPGALGRQMVGTPARSCTSPAEMWCPQPLGKRLLLHFCNTLVCWSTEQNAGLQLHYNCSLCIPRSRKVSQQGTKMRWQSSRFTLLPSRHIAPMAMIYWTEINIVWSSEVCLVVSYRIYYIFTVVT